MKNNLFKRDIGPDTLNVVLQGVQRVQGVRGPTVPVSSSVEDGGTSTGGRGGASTRVEDGRASRRGQ